MVEIPGSGVWRAQRSWLLPPGLVTTAARDEATLAPGARWDDVLLRTTATSPPGWALLPASFAPGAACGGRRVRVRWCSAARSLPCVGRAPCGRVFQDSPVKAISGFQ